MCIDFVTAASQIIQTEQVETLFIPLKTGQINLQNVALASKYDSNLISLSHLKETGIIFYHNSTSIALMKDRKIIAHAKRSQNLFIFNLTTSKKAMKISDEVDTPKQIHRTMKLRKQSQAMYLVSKNRRIKI